MEFVDWIRRVFILSVLCLTYGSPVPINNSTNNPIDDFLNPASKCAFPPREMFQDASPYNGICSNTPPVGSNTSVLDTNSSLCFALRFVSDKLCTNDSVIETIKPGIANFSAILTSNVITPAETFCNEFQKSVTLSPNESTAEIDAFFRSFFFNTIVYNETESGANLCVKSCKSSDPLLGINAICTLANAGFEIMKLYLQSAKLDTHAGERFETPKVLELSSPDSPVPEPVRSSQGKLESVNTEAIKLPEQSALKNQTVLKAHKIPDSQLELETVSKEPAIGSMVYLSPENKNTNDEQFSPIVGETSSSIGNPLSAVNSQFNLGSSSATPSSGKELPGNQVKPPTPERSEVADLGKSSSQTPDNKEEPFDDDSEEFLRPDRTLQTTLDQNEELDSKDTSNMDGKKSDILSQVQPVKSVNSFGNTAAGEDILEEESPGYFGYFLTFLGISCLFFIMFHNKKRLIALVVEGRKPRGGRRRSGSGSAAYRKLENNFE